MFGRSPRSLAAVCTVALAAFAAFLAFDWFAGGGERAMIGGPIELAPAVPAAPTLEPVPSHPAAAPQPRVRGVLVVHVSWRDSKDPVARARVAVLPDSASGSWSLGEQRDADDRGVATFELDAGHYRVATARGGEAGQFPVRSGRTTDVHVALDHGYSVAGTVVDEWQRGVADASIWLSQRWSNRRGAIVAHTDATGRFRIDGVCGHRLVSATARRYAPSHQYEVDAADGETRELTLELRSGGAELAGRVVDPGGRPLPGAIVLLGDERVVDEARDETGRGLAAPLPRLLRADDGGRFAATGLRAGSTRVQIRATGFAPADVDLTAVPGGGVEQLVQMQREAIVFGTVHDRHNEIVHGATVGVGAADAFGASVARTDPNGAYELHGLPAQLVEIVASKQQIGRARGELVLRSGVRTPWNPILEDPGVDAGTLLAGTVVDAEGRPQAKLRVSVGDAAGGMAPGSQLRTNADGRFRTRVRWKSVRIVVQADDERAFPLLVVDDVQPIDGPVRLELPEASRGFARIEGQVVSPDGQAQRARLTIWHRQAELWREVATNGEGVLQVEGVLPGELELEIRAEGHPWVVLGKRAAVGGETLQLGTIHLPQAGRINGTFTVPAGIEPAALQFSIYRDRGPEGAVIRTRDGSFASGPLAPAEYEVRIQGRGVRMFNRRVAVHVGAASTLHADLLPAAVRTVVVVVPDGVHFPRGVSLQVRDGHGDLAWSGGAEQEGEQGTEVSLAPGDYVLHAIGDDGWTGRVPLHIEGLAPVDEPIRVELQQNK